MLKIPVSLRQCRSSQVNPFIAPEERSTDHNQ